MTRDRPRLGFVGVGWIGGLRLDAVDRAAAAEVVALCERDPARLRELGERFPGASRHQRIEELLEERGREVEGLVIATPNALHASQATATLERGIPVFVQKPLGLDQEEVGAVVGEAERRGRNVCVDFSYRHLEGAKLLRERVRAGGLGEVHLAEGVFHNAYGPDKAWCFDPDLSGGGALLDLGVHLLDLVFWILGPAVPRTLQSRVLEMEGHPGIDRFTSADAVLDSGLQLRLTCSWHAHAGRDCDFRLVLHGTGGSAELRNVDGSFYDFELALREGRREEVLARESREWMDRGILEWIDRLSCGGGYDPGAAANVAVARMVDGIYARSAAPSEGADGRNPAGRSVLPSSDDASPGASRSGERLDAPEPRAVRS